MSFREVSLCSGHRDLLSQDIGEGKARHRIVRRKAKSSQEIDSSRKAIILVIIQPCIVMCISLAELMAVIDPISPVVP